MASLSSYYAELAKNKNILRSFDKSVRVRKGSVLLNKDIVLSQTPMLPQIINGKQINISKSTFPNQLLNRRQSLAHPSFDSAHRLRSKFAAESADTVQEMPVPLKNQAAIHKRRSTLQFASLAPIAAPAPAIIDSQGPLLIIKSMEKPPSLFFTPPAITDSKEIIVSNDSCLQEDSIKLPSKNRKSKFFTEALSPAESIKKMMSLQKLAIAKDLKNKSRHLKAISLSSDALKEKKKSNTLPEEMMKRKIEVLKKLPAEQMAKLKEALIKKKSTACLPIIPLLPSSPSASPSSLLQPPAPMPNNVPSIRRPSIQRKSISLRALSINPFEEKHVEISSKYCNPTYFHQIERKKVKLISNSINTFFDSKVDPKELLETTKLSSKKPSPRNLKRETISIKYGTPKFINKKCAIKLHSMRMDKYKKSVKDVAAEEDF